MTFLRNVSDRFWSYVSPRKTQQRREKPYTFKVPSIPVHTNALLRKQSAAQKTIESSPESRVQTWTPRTPSPQSDDIDVTLLPPSPPTSSPQLYDDLEGDTLLPGSPVSNDDLDKTGSSEDEWNANEDTMVVDDGTYMELSKKVNHDVERRRRDKQGRELRDAGWSEDAVFLFQKLGMRGFEPILPIDWLDDFETLPEDLFTANLDKAFIKPSGGSNYHGMYLTP